MIRTILAWKNILSPALRVFDVFFSGEYQTSRFEEEPETYNVFIFPRCMYILFVHILIIFINITSDWTILFLVLSYCCALK